MENGKGSFSIRGALREGWELTKLNMGFLVTYQIILYFIIGLSNTLFEKRNFFVFFIFGLIINMLGKMGFYRSALLLVQGKSPRFDQFYINWRLFPSWLMASILFGFLISLCFIVSLSLIGWGFYYYPLFPLGNNLISFGVAFLILTFTLFFILVSYGLYPFFILDKGLGPIQALKRSAQVTKGIRWRILVLFLACIGLNLLGLLCFIVGVLITIPIALIGIASVYEKITGQSKTSIQPDDILPPADSIRDEE